MHGTGAIIIRSVGSQLGVYWPSISRASRSCGQYVGPWQMTVPQVAGPDDFVVDAHAGYHHHKHRDALSSSKLRNPTRRLACVHHLYDPEGLALVIKAHKVRLDGPIVQSVVMGYHVEIAA